MSLIECPVSVSCILRKSCLQSCPVSWGSPVFGPLSLSESYSQLFQCQDGLLCTEHWYLLESEYLDEYLDWPDTRIQISAFFVHTQKLFLKRFQVWNSVYTLWTLCAHVAMMIHVGGYSRRWSHRIPRWSSWPPRIRYLGGGFTLLFVL